MSTTRLTIRIPRDLAARLSEVASAAGYPSACGLARSVLVQFLRNRQAVADEASRHADWMDEFAELAEAARHDPTERKRINERR